MAMQESGWSYYIPSNGETLGDAEPLKRYHWQRKMYDAEDAAAWASEVYWDNGGYECGIDQETEAVIIDPKGQETFWTFTYEETINYMAEMRKVDS
jgi:hypothetical protein